MAITNIIQIVSGIMISIGGASGIIIGVSKWLSKLIADKQLIKLEQKSDLQLEKYKNELNIELIKLQTINQKMLNITNVINQKEYEIYIDLWDNLILCIQQVLMLYPILERVPTEESAKKAFQKQKYDRTEPVFNKFVTDIEKYAPFYKKDIYDNLILIESDCRKIIKYFIKYEFDIKDSPIYYRIKDKEMPSEIFSEISEINEHITTTKKILCEQLRNYLTNICINS